MPIILDELVDNVFERTARLINELAEDHPPPERFMNRLLKGLQDIRDKTFDDMDRTTEEGFLEMTSSRPVHPAVDKFLIRLGRR